MRKRDFVPAHLELGDLLSVCQEVIFIDGKRLTDADICHLALLSPKTYIKVKRA